VFDFVCVAGGESAALGVIRVLTAVFLAILFLQSGIDKIVDRKGNLEWLGGHFASSPLASVVPPMVTLITLVEIVAGILAGVGAIAIALTGNTVAALIGAELAALALVMLFFGQRLAKDYAGAAVLVPYFLLSIVAILLFSSVPA
jgi:hypothetical protein